MICLSDLLIELETLRKGNISTKTIYGKRYYYLQYLVNGKINSEYIKKEFLPIIRKELKRRKEIESILKKEEKKINLSKRSDSLTGYIMMGDVQVAKFTNRTLDSIDKQKAPLFLVRTKNLEEYLRYRTIDLDRPNARLLLKTLGITNKEKFIALYSHGATISDNYWFKPSGSKLRYKDIEFSNDLYSDLALKGKILPLPSLGSNVSPEITNIGSFEKCWKIRDNHWCLYKQGKEDEIFSELFSYHLALVMNIPTAVYEYDDGYIRSLNFTEKYNFEPIYSLMDNNEDYFDVFNCLYNLDKKIAEEYLKLIIFDLIIYNVDRHNQNYGLLRSKTTGKIISLAPNFDNNLALLSYNKTLDQIPSKDFMIQLFVKFINKSKEAKSMFISLDIKTPSNKELNEIYTKIPIKRNEKLINSFILNRVKYIKELQKK